MGHMIENEMIINDNNNNKKKAVEFIEKAAQLG